MTTFESLHTPVPHHRPCITLTAHRRLGLATWSRCPHILVTMSVPESSWHQDPTTAPKMWPPGHVSPTRDLMKEMWMIFFDERLIRVEAAEIGAETETGIATAIGGDVWTVVLKSAEKLTDFMEEMECHVHCRQWCEYLIHTLHCKNEWQCIYVQAVHW